MKKVSVVILNWNGRELLRKFLPSVIQHSSLENVEIVVADNFSTDTSVEFLKQNYPQITLIPFQENYGYAGGYNKALSLIEAEYAVLLNSDVEVTENWLSSMLQYMEENTQVVAVQPKILSYAHKEYFEYAGACGGFIDKYGYPFCRGRIFSTLEKDQGQYDSPLEIFWASGACLMIKVQEFKDCGGFDEHFFAHMEEIDLCWRINRSGKKIMCLPQSVIYHVGAATLSSESPRKTFLNFRNNLLMLYKNLPEKEYRKILRIRILLDWLAAIQMLVSAKPKNSIAVLKAHKEFNKLKPTYEKQTAENIPKLSFMYLKTLYPKSILYKYYMKNIKVFSKLHFNLPALQKK